MTGWRKSLLLLVFTGTLLALMVTYSRYNTMVNAQEKKQAEPSKILIVWTSGDKEVAVKMIFMYTFNAKRQGWFDEIQLLIWGPSSKLLSEDTELQDYLKKIKDAGVQLTACKACSDMYGVSDKLMELGVDVKYMGRPLTDMLNSGWVTLTF